MSSERQALKAALELYAKDLVSEECAEAIQMSGKWGRFGPDHARRDGLTARRGLSIELGDVLASIDFGLCAGILDAETILAQRDKKFARLIDADAVDDEGRRLAPELPTHDKRLSLRATSQPVGDGGVLLKWITELARRDVQREMTDFIGRMNQALGDFESICDEHPNGDFDEAVRDDAGEALAALAGLALAQLAMVSNPADPLAALSTRTLNGARVGHPAGPHLDNIPEHVTPIVTGAVGLREARS